MNTEILTHPDKQPRVRAGTGTVQHQDLDFPPPPSDSECPKPDKFSRWYTIDYFESVCLSAVSDFKRKCFIQKQREGNFLNF